MCQGQARYLEMNPVTENMSINIFGKKKLMKYVSQAFFLENDVEDWLFIFFKFCQKNRCSKKICDLYSGCTTIPLTNQPTICKQGKWRLN